MSPGSSGHIATAPVGVAGSAGHEPVVSSASTTLGRGSASGSLARFELSAQARRRSEDLTPAASTTSERSAMLAHPSTELVARAPCQLRQSHARPVRAARARLRQQRRLEVDKTRKRDVQTGGVAGPSSRPSRWLFFLRWRLPLTVVNWGSIICVQCVVYLIGTVSTVKLEHILASFRIYTL